MTVLVTVKTRQKPQNTVLEACGKVSNVALKIGKLWITLWITYENLPQE